MLDAFLPYEKEFNNWIMEGYPSIKNETREFIENVIDDSKRERKLWTLQKKAILRIIYSYEILGKKSLLLNIVTGGGKTLIIAATIAWLKMSQGINKFLILVPNLIVRDRLESDFDDAKVFKSANLFPKNREHYINELDLHVLEVGAATQGILESGVLLGNVQQFYQSHISGKRNLAYIMNFIGDMAIFNDEAHNTPAPEYSDILYRLSPKSRLRLDTTATPDRADGRTPDSEMIYLYTITDALQDTPPIIKNIVVYEPDTKAVELTYTNIITKEKRVVTELDRDFKDAEENIRPFQWILDPEPLKKQIAIALQRHEEQKRRARARYKPVLFVVTMSIQEAHRVQKMFKEEFGIDALVVTEESDETDREEARKIGSMTSRYETVISVLMLREGWDVPEVCTLLLLRKFSSPVYGQQVVGRGLRRVIRDKIEPEILAVVDHPKLHHDWLWRIVAVSKIRQGVLPEDKFADEDMPEKPKIQRLVKPDKFIVIPSPEYSTAIDWDKVKQSIKDDQKELSWREILDRIEYDKEVWQITKTKMEHIKVKTPLDRRLEVINGVDVETSEESEPQSRGALEEGLKRGLLNMATDLLVEAGFGGLKKGKLYGAVMDHVIQKIFNGKSLSEASDEEIEFALYILEDIKSHFTKSIIAGILGE